MRGVHSTPCAHLHEPFLRPSVLKRDFKRLEALRGMQQLLADYGARFPDLMRGEARKELDKVTRELDQLALSQGVNAFRTRGERKHEAKLATALRVNFFGPLIAVGKLDEFVGTAIGLIRYPYRRTNTTKLVIAARSAIRVASRWRAKVGRAVAADFLERFAAAADQLEASTGIKGSTRISRTGSTRAIDDRIKWARKVVSAVNALVRAGLDDDDPLLAPWDSLVREFRYPGGKPARRAKA